MASQSVVNSISPTPQEPTTKITRGHSCILCQQRKVKCDRQKPCANCVKARAECIVASPSQPRRRRKKLTESDLVMRLRRYEHLLKANGIKVEPSDIYPEEQPKWLHENYDITDVKRLSLNVPRAPDSTGTGAWFFGKDKSAQFVENTLWESMKDEIAEYDASSSEDDVLETDEMPPGELVVMGFHGPAIDLLPYHPSVAHIFRLWQIFLDNVNPLVKIFHAPTVQEMITKSSSDLENISKPNEALLFAIYFLATLSMEPKECQEIFGETQQKLIARYCRSVQQALVNAKILRTMNLTTLQAYILFLLGGRRLYDAHTVWALSGLAVRIAQRMGIHTNEGVAKFPPFDAEMRRRTWWQLVFLEGHSSKLAGAAFPVWVTKFDSKLPANLSDSELSPSMSELPASKEGGLSEMMMVAMRHETVSLLRNAPTFVKTNPDGTTRDCTPSELIELKDQAIEQLQERLHTKFIQYCDPSVPVQLVMIVMAKSVISTMKVMAHHPRNYPDKGISMPQHERDFLFRECLTELEVQTLGHETPSIRRFLWHNHVYFQYDAFIYLLNELQNRTTGPLVDQAWRGLERVYHHRPELITDTKNILFVAIGGLVLKAWAKREEALNMYHAMPPRFVSLLRAQKSGTQSKSSTQSPQTNASMDFTTPGAPSVMESRNNFPFMPSVVPMPDQMVVWGDQSFDYSVEAPMSIPSAGGPMPDWEYWQTLMDGDLPSYMVDPAQQDWM